ncbi:MAG: quinone-dependent dihydroorotate dehydrogenase [bacterium]
MYSLLRKALFASALPEERAHDFALGVLAAASRSASLTASLRKRCAPVALPRTLMGIEFPNPVGLAAGLDKRADACNALHALGFGWVEVGTVTPLPQRGNPKPRLFRLAEHDALINRMGFNSNGLDSFCRNLARADASVIKGVNIGKNAATEIAQARDDYLACLDAVHAYADYVAINLSSPNTRGLRALQRADALAPLLGALDRRRMELAEASGRRMPLVLKIAPDLDRAALDDIADLARAHRIDGIAATNTTAARAGVEHHPLASEAGGLSGPPLAPLATVALAHLRRNLQGEIALIGIGGIDSPKSALARFHAGADLVQLYTGFIHHGPRLIGDIVARLRHESGTRTLSQWLAEVREASA